MNPEYQAKHQPTDRFPRAKGLAEDVRFYGRWMREEAFRRIGAFYPAVNGQTVIAWLWARTVACPNPACRAEAPWCAPSGFPRRRARRLTCPRGGEGRGGVPRENRSGRPAPGGTVNRRGARCLVCGTPIPLEHVRAEGRAGRMGARLMAIVTEERGGRGYHAPDPEHEAVAQSILPTWKPDFEFAKNSRHMTPWVYGLERFSDLFTPRQLLALATFSDLVAEARERVYQDALEAGLPDDPTPLAEGGRGARAYAEAVGVYLALGVGKAADYHASLCIWHVSRETIAHVFNRQALPMTWDFAEANPFSESTGSWEGMVDWVASALETLPASPPGTARQANALDSVNGVPSPPLISTDPLTTTTCPTPTFPTSSMFGSAGT